MDEAEQFLLSLLHQKGLDCTKLEAYYYGYFTFLKCNHYNIVQIIGASHLTTMHPLIRYAIDELAVMHEEKV